MKKYAIDTCSLINAAKNYNPTKAFFAPLWKEITDMIAAGTLISSVEVRDEVKDEDLVKWCKQNDGLFLPLTEEIQRKTIIILRDFPTMIKMKSTGNSNADPFLIATAILENAIVVSDEQPGDESSGNYKLPNVCRKYGIECITLRDFLDTILE